jgi:hypothetical protein
MVIPEGLGDFSGVSFVFCGEERDSMIDDVLLFDLELCSSSPLDLTDEPPLDLSDPSIISTLATGFESISGCCLRSRSSIVTGGGKS